MFKALASGLAGAIALTVLHETARQFIKDAPRVDVTGERAADRVLSAVGVDVIAKKDLYPLALIGDVVSNSAFYSLAALGGSKNAVLTGTVLGLTAGIGTAFLPGRINLGDTPTARTAQTAAMTVAWYTIGGIAAGLAYKALTGDSDEQRPEG